MVLSWIVLGGFKFQKTVCFWNVGWSPWGLLGRNHLGVFFWGQILADPSNPTAISYNQLLASGAFHAVAKTLLRFSKFMDS